MLVRDLLKDLCHHVIGQPLVVPRVTKLLHRGFDHMPPLGEGGVVHVGPDDTGRTSPVSEGGPTLDMLRSDPGANGIGRLHPEAAVQGDPICALIG